MSAVIAFFLGPIGRYVGLALIASAVVGGIYAKGRSDGSAAAYATVERQQKRAIALATKAREHLAEACERDPKTCVPDTWFREEDE